MYLSAGELSQYNTIFHPFVPSALNTVLLNTFCFQIHSMQRKSRPVNWSYGCVRYRVIDRPILLLLALVDVMNSIDFSLGRVYMCNIIFGYQKLLSSGKQTGNSQILIHWIAIYPVGSAIHPLNNWSLIWEVCFFNAEAELHSSTYLIDGVGWYNNSVDLQY